MQEELGEETTAEYDSLTRIFRLELPGYQEGTPTSAWYFALAGLLKNSGIRNELLHDAPVPRGQEQDNPAQVRGHELVHGGPDEHRDQHQEPAGDPGEDRSGDVLVQRRCSRPGSRRRLRRSQARNPRTNPKSENPIRVVFLPMFSLRRQVRCSVYKNCRATVRRNGPERGDLPSSRTSTRTSRRSRRSSKDVGETQVYCLGDIVGYGASPNEVVRLLRERRVTCILGNHDFAALTGRVGRVQRAGHAGSRPGLRGSSAKRTGSSSRSLPRATDHRLRGRKVYMTHGSPDDNLWEYVYPATHSDLFGFYLQEAGRGRHRARSHPRPLRLVGRRGDRLQPRLGGTAADGRQAGLLRAPQGRPDGNRGRAPERRVRRRGRPPGR